MNILNPKPRIVEAVLRLGQEDWDMLVRFRNKVCGKEELSQSEKRLVDAIDVSVGFLEGDDEL